jgi:hypothetical protein
MFDRFKKAFAKPAPAPAPRSNPVSRLDEGPVSEWAATRGLVFSADPSGGAVALEGRVQGKPWRLERGAPTRDYIRGEELRARAKLGLHEDVSVLVMNRPLKNLLERRAYQSYTDDLQTSLGNNLPQEVRWLALFEEFGWADLPEPFLDRFSVHAERRESAQGWVAPQLAQLLLEWPEPAPPADVPFMLLLLQGKAYLRMQYTPADLPTLQHAALVFTRACEAALAAPSLR